MTNDQPDNDQPDKERVDEGLARFIDRLPEFIESLKPGSVRRPPPECTEEQARSEGQRVSYRLDELDHHEHEWVSSHEDGPVKVDVFKHGQESAIALITKRRERMRYTPDFLVNAYLRTSWLFPQRTRVAWGYIDKKVGFINPTFSEANTDKDGDTVDPYAILSVDQFSVGKENNVIRRRVEVFGEHTFTTGHVHYLFR